MRGELDGLTRAHVDPIVRLYHPQDGGGTITLKELGAVFESLGQKPSEEELEDMMKEIDDDNNGSIDLAEFCKLMGAPPTRTRSPSLHSALALPSWLWHLASSFQPLCPGAALLAE